ncbi:MAG: ATP-binding protein, partial [Chloroflexota bacterium]
ERNPMGQIRVSLSFESSSIVMETRDLGKPAQVDLSEVSMPDPLDLAEGGYGLAIINSLMDELHYHTENGQNIWRMTKFRE